MFSYVLVTVLISSFLVLVFMTWWVVYLYILRGFKKLIIASSFFWVKNTPKVINKRLKNWIKIVNWKKKVSYCFFLL